MKLEFRLNKHLWVGLLSSLLGAWVYWTASGWDDQSIAGAGLSMGIYPRLVGAALVLTGVLLILRARKIKGEPASINLLGPTAVVLALILAYFFLIPYLGFFRAGFLFVATLMLLLRGTAWWKALLTAAGIAGMVWVVFSYLLKVQFPAGSIFG